MKEYRCGKCKKLLFKYKSNMDLDGILQFKKIDGISALVIENKCPKCSHVNAIDFNMRHQLDIK